MVNVTRKPNAYQKAVELTGFKSKVFAEALDMSLRNYQYFARNPRNVSDEQATIIGELLGKTKAEVVLLCRGIE